MKINDNIKTTKAIQKSIKTKESFINELEKSKDILKDKGIKDLLAFKDDFSTSLDKISKNEDLNKLSNQKLANTILYQLSMRENGIFGGEKEDKYQEESFDFLSPFYGLKAFKKNKNDLFDLLTMNMNIKVRNIELEVLKNSSINELDGLVFDQKLKDDFKEEFGSDIKLDKQSLEKYEQFFKDKLKKQAISS